MKTTFYSPVGRGVALLKAKGSVSYVLSDEETYDMHEDDSPFCECNLDPTEDELVDNVCDACGRPLE